MIGFVNSRLVPISRAFVLVELFILSIILLTFWHHSPPIRDNWLNLLWLAIPVFTVRFVIWGTLLKRATSTDLGVLSEERAEVIPIAISFITILVSIALLAVMLFNFTNAPNARQSFWVLVCRPLLGMWIIIFSIDCVRVYRKCSYLLYVSLAMGCVVGTLGLIATQWHTKSDSLDPITRLLPTLPFRQFLPDMMLSFNPNEIGGAIAWLFPLMFVLVWHKPIRVFAFPIAVLLGFALFLGQSRFALLGVGVALGLFALFHLKSRMRWTVLGGLVCVAVLQGVILLGLPTGAPQNDLPTAPTLSARDASSLSTRLELWNRGLRMLSDYPITGVGMNMFRRAIRTPDYQIEYFERINFTAPHAHNELIQIAADLGVFGVLFWVGGYGVIFFLLWRVIRQKYTDLTILAWAVGAGLLAHLLYGMGDAITLFDRYAFLGWWLYGLGMGIYAEVQIRRYNEDKQRQH